MTGAVPSVTCVRWPFAPDGPAVQWLTSTGNQWTSWLCEDDFLGNSQFFRSDHQMESIRTGLNQITLKHLSGSNRKRQQSEKLPVHSPATTLVECEGEANGVSSFRMSSQMLSIICVSEVPSAEMCHFPFKLCSASQRCALGLAAAPVLFKTYSLNQTKACAHRHTNACTHARACTHTHTLGRGLCNLT